MDPDSPSDAELPRGHGELDEPTDADGYVANPFQLLMRDARRHPLLSPEEEIDLARRIERGDLAAKERLVNSNIRLVVSYAKRSQGSGMPLSDLVQEGMLGLIRASEKFDYRRGFRFSTYATFWIRQAIQRGMATSGHTIRLPLHIGLRERKIGRAVRELSSIHGRDPTPDEIAVHADLSPDEVREVLAMPRAAASLDRPLGDDGDALSLSGLLASTEPQPYEEVETVLRRQAVLDALDVLTERERTVIELRFGLTSGGLPARLADVAATLGLSTERVRQLERGALERLAATGELEWLGEAA